MPLDINKYIDKKTKKQKLSGVWKFIIAYILFQLFFISFTQGAIIAMLTVAITWIPILFLPCLFKYIFKKKFTKKTAIIYSVIAGIVLFIGNIVIDIAIKTTDPNASTTTVWNLLMMIVPYYLLTDEPMFSKRKTKEEHAICDDE